MSVEEIDKKSSTFKEYSDYLKYKLPGALVIGGVYGINIGYMLGDMAALYGYTHSFGLGFMSWSFYSVAFSAKLARGVDDVYNYGFSGAFTSGCITSAIYGLKRAPIAVIGGAAGGALLKYSTDYSYDAIRSAWLGYRKFTIENSHPRTLLVRKPSFRPKNNNKSN
mmetsp:Transcript_5044/g.5175  ORF Transcript_5044/g.5175 Transcript_5044/m.5175 type:complete len:166 (+) Transcript_5044:133-630(+)